MQNTNLNCNVWYFYFFILLGTYYILKIEIISVACACNTVNNVVRQIPIIKWNVNNIFEYMRSIRVQLNNDDIKTRSNSSYSITICINNYIFIS